MTKSADGTPNGTEVPFVSLRNAEIRLKGNLGGSFRDLSEKPGLKLKFKKTEAALGLRKMTLNNSYGASNLNRTPPIEGGEPSGVATCSPTWGKKAPHPTFGSLALPRDSAASSRSLSLLLRGWGGTRSRRAWSGGFSTGSTAGCMQSDTVGSLPTAGGWPLSSRMGAVP